LEIPAFCFRSTGLFPNTENVTSPFPMAPAASMDSQPPVTVAVSRSRLQAMAKRRRHGVTGTPAKVPNPDSKDMANTAVICAKVILEHLLVGDIASADQYLDEKVNGFRGTSCKAFYHSIINACARAGSADAAVWCAVRMVRIGLRPNVVTFNSLLDASAKAGDLKLATFVWRVMSDYGTKPNEITFNTMINACAQARDGPMAEVWLEEMQKHGLKPCAVSFSTLMAAFAKTGNTDKAEIWFERMREAKIEPDRIIFNSMVDVSTRAGCPERAEHWLLRMMKAGINPEKKVLNSMIQAWGKRGNLERAEYWFNHMDMVSKTDKVAFASLIHACIKAGNINRAESWLTTMSVRGITPTTSMYNDVLHHAFEVHNDFDGAMLWYSKMIADGIKPNTGTYNRLSNICDRTGKRCPILDSMGNMAADEDADEDGTDDGSDQNSGRIQTSQGFKLQSSDVGKLREMMAQNIGILQSPPGLEPPSHFAFPAVPRSHFGHNPVGPAMRQPLPGEVRHQSCPNYNPQQCPLWQGGSTNAPPCLAYASHPHQPQQPQHPCLLQQQPPQPHNMVPAIGGSRHIAVGVMPKNEQPRMIGPRAPIRNVPAEGSMESAIRKPLQQHEVLRTGWSSTSGRVHIPCIFDDYEQADYSGTYHGQRDVYSALPFKRQVEHGFNTKREEPSYFPAYGCIAFDSIAVDCGSTHHRSQDSLLEDSGSDGDMLGELPAVSHQMSDHMRVVF